MKLQIPFNKLLNSYENLINFRFKSSKNNYGFLLLGIENMFIINLEFKTEELLHLHLLLYISLDSYINGVLSPFICVNLKLKHFPCDKKQSTKDIFFVKIIPNIFNH